VHAESSELLYLKTGKVRMRIAGATMEASAGDVVYIPRGVEHSASVDGEATVEAVQIYVGPGPEQRFTQGERL
jgi:mannose-6-phosphate isomerase-like protein (cupin superfamily)